MSVSRKELFDTKRSGTMNGSDQHDITDSSRDELASAEDESPHEDIAQLTVRLQQCGQLFASDLDKFTRLVRTNANRTNDATSRTGMESNARRAAYPATRYGLATS